MAWQNDGGQPWAHGMTEGTRPQSPHGGRVSPNDAIHLYALNLGALQENLRRRDRANWFFLALSFVSLPALILLLVGLGELGWDIRIPFMHTMVSFVALLGVAMCLVWRGVLRYGQDQHEKLVETIRRLEYDHIRGYSPLGEEETNPLIKPKARLFSLWEELLPLAALLIFCGVIFYVWREEARIISEWCWALCLSIVNWFWPLAT